MARLLSRCAIHQVGDAVESEVAVAVDTSANLLGFQRLDCMKDAAVPNEPVDKQ